MSFCKEKEKASKPEEVSQRLRWWCPFSGLLQDSVYSRLPLRWVQSYVKQVAAAPSANGELG